MGKLTEEADAQKLLDAAVGKGSQDEYDLWFCCLVLGLRRYRAYLTTRLAIPERDRPQFTHGEIRTKIRLIDEWLLDNAGSYNSMRERRRVR